MESAAPEEDSVPPRISGSRFYDCLNAEARTITTVPHVLSLQRTAERTREYLNQFQENKVCLRTSVIRGGVCVLFLFC